MTLNYCINYYQYRKDDGHLLFNELSLYIRHGRGLNGSIYLCGTLLALYLPTYKLWQYVPPALSTYIQRHTHINTTPSHTVHGKDSKPELRDLPLSDLVNRVVLQHTTSHEFKANEYST